MDPESMDRALPRGVRHVCRVLVDAGESAWVVGGSVRDVLGGRPPVDWDVATTARPERVVGLFGRVIPTGIAHGTVTVLVGGESIEVTTLRGDGAYSDGRRPDAVEFLEDIEHDLARRDFTINAIAWDAETRVLHDPFGGRADLAAGVIRAVGDPEARFAEDGLRILRAARFAATLGFTVEPATLAAAGALAPMLERVSAERKREELVRLLLAPDPTPGLEVLIGAGMVAHLIPALHSAMASGGLALAERAVRRVAAATGLPVRLAAMLLEVPPRAAEGWLEGLRFDRVTRKQVAGLLEVAPGAVVVAEPAPGEVRRRLARIGRAAAPELLELVDAETAVGGRTTFCEVARGVLAAGDPLAVGELAIRGDRLMAAVGIGPGPLLGHLLSGLLAHVLEHPADNRADRLVALAAETIVSQGRAGRVQ